MCYKKPGPRCAKEAAKVMHGYIRQYQLDPSEENMRLAVRARHEWYCTPAGIEDLKKRGEVRQAREYEFLRAERIRAAKGRGIDISHPRVQDILSRHQDLDTQQVFDDVMFEASLAGTDFDRLRLLKENGMMREEVALHSPESQYVLSTLERKLQSYRTVMNAKAFTLDKPGKLEDYSLDEFGRPERIWYASYGSNMREKRMLTYIYGGNIQGKSWGHEGCRDKTPPRGEIPIRYEHTMTFAGSSSRWRGGIAFLDPEPGGVSLGRAYNISSHQFDDVLSQENGWVDHKSPEVHDINKAIGGRAQVGWGIYDTLVHVGDYQGAPVMTMTGSESRDSQISDSAVRYARVSRPSAAYIRMISGGLKEAFNFDEEECADYILGLPGSNTLDRDFVLDSLNDLPGTYRMNRHGIM